MINTPATSSPKVSIIIPTFNSVVFLAKSLTSVLSQSFRDFEIVIVDGVSKDETIALIEPFAENDPRIRYISEKDKGIYDAMNKGIALARGEWLLFLGSDDHLHDDDVLLEMSQHLTGSLDLVYGNVLICGDVDWARDGHIYDGEFTAGKLVERNISHQCIFYHKRVFQIHGQYDLRYKVCADWEFNIRIFRQCRKKHVDVVVADFYSGGLSTTSKDHEMEVRFVELVSEHLRPSPFHRYYKWHLDALELLVRRQKQKGNYRRMLQFGFIWSLHAPVFSRALHETKRRLTRH